MVLAGIQFCPEGIVKLGKGFLGDRGLPLGNEPGEQLQSLRRLRERSDGDDDVRHDELFLLGALLAAGEQAEAEDGKDEAVQFHQSRLPLVLGVPLPLRTTACASARPSPFAADSSRWCPFFP